MNRRRGTRDRGRQGAGGADGAVWQRRDALLTFWNSALVTSVAARREDDDETSWVQSSRGQVEEEESEEDTGSGGAGHEGEDGEIGLGVGC